MSDTAVREEIKRRIKYCLLECFRFLSLMYVQNLTENPRKFPVHRGTTILRAEMKCPVCTWGCLKCALVLNSWLQGWGVPQPLPSATPPKDAWGLLLLCWVLFCLDIKKRKWLFVVGSDFPFKSCDFWTTLSWCFYSFSVTKKHKKGILKEVSKKIAESEKTLAGRRPIGRLKIPLKYYQTSIKLVLTLFSYF